MAFVYKAERNLGEKIGDTDLIGPGEYLPITDLKNIKINKLPFASGEIRIKSSETIVPGPGTYYQDKTMIKYLTNLQNEKISEENDKDILRVTKGGVYLKPECEKLGFTTKQKRFRVIQSCSPGPGEYDPNFIEKKRFNLKNSEIVQEQINKTRKIRLRKNSSNFSSIPTLYNTFGYEILPNGDIKSTKNPNFFKKFSGEKGDTVGPGAYDVDSPSYWYRTGTQWSKFKSKKCDLFNDHKISEKNGKTEEKFIKTFNNSFQSTSYSEKFYRTTYFNPFNNSGQKFLQDRNSSVREKNSLNKKNIFNYRVKKCISFNNRKANIKHDLEQAFKNNTPSPGYYNTEKYTSIHAQTLPEFKQYFGSKLARFQPLIKNDNLGPGTYFQDVENGKDDLIIKEKLDRKLKSFAPFSSKSERFEQEKLKNVKPGPGEYETTKKYPEPSNKANQFSRFGSCERRFVNKGDKWKNAVPGPGSYINPYTGTGILNTVKFNGFIVDLEKAKTLSRIHNETIDDDARSIVDKKFHAPSVGTYDPDSVLTINYKVQKNIATMPMNKDVAFCSRKTKNKKTLFSNVGPGYYYTEKKIKKQQVSPPFKMADIRGPLEKSEFTIGPGQYNLDSYFKWNKKTYNTNFV